MAKEMDFATLINTKTEEILNKNEEYQNILKLEDERKNLLREYDKCLYPSLYGYGPMYGLEDCEKEERFKRAQEVVDSYEKDKSELFAKMNKSLFKKKYLREMDYLEKLTEVARRMLDVKKQYENAEKLWNDGGYTDRKNEIIEPAVLKVLKENRNEPVVENAFLKSIQEDGRYAISAAYSGFAFVAGNLINKEVTKMLMKTKYKEKLDDLKTQLEEREVEDTDSEK